jgi:hypothetical protein
MHRVLSSRFGVALAKVASVRHTVGAIVCFGLLSGCATGPLFTPDQPAPSDQAQLYVYRPGTLIGGAVAHKISIDGQSETLSLPNSSWQRVLLSPGRHTVSVRDYFNAMQCGAVAIEAKVGQTTYLADVVTVTQGLGHQYLSCHLEPKPEAKAFGDIQQLRGAQ